MQKTKFYAIFLVSVMFVGIFSISTVISLLTNNVIIKSTGIVTAPMAPIVSYKSEIRGVFIHESIFNENHNWATIADTLAQYKIDAVFVNILGTAGGIHSEEELPGAIEAFHSKGIEYHAVMNVLGDIAISSEVETVDHTGARNGWNCPIKIRPVVKQTVEKLASYDIDGFMFDYIRYSEEDMCYCSECKNAFQRWLGENITNWTPFYPGGARHNEFMEWRTVPVTELVRDIRTWMLAINPDLKFSLSAWTLFDNVPTYWRYWIGQDTAYWIAQGYIDFVAPMMYTTQLTGDPESIEAYFRECNKYFTAGPEGKIPHTPFITTGWEGWTITPTQFANVVNKLRELGADGWIIFAYGGPGAGYQYGYPDIRNYLSQLSLPDTFSLENIQVSASGIVTWTTNLPSSSKVEYSTSPLFTASYKYWSGTGFYFWDIDHVSGSIIQDATLVTDHKITLTGLLPRTQYYFRVQSQDPSGIATSKVSIFTTES